VYRVKGIHNENIHINEQELIHYEQIYSRPSVIQPKWDTGGLDYLGIWFTKEKLHGTSQMKKSPLKAEVELLRAKILHLRVNNNNNNNNSYTWNITHDTLSTAV